MLLKYILVIQLLGVNMRFCISVLALALSVTPAFAGFGSWTAEIEKDPFSGGERVTVDFLTSIRSGIFIFCDSSEQGIRVRAVAGFAFTDEMVGLSPLMLFAIDGQKIDGNNGVTQAVGDNVAAVEIELTDASADQFVKNFIGAKKQIAIKDGISDRPYLLSTNGSKKSGNALSDCLNKQTK